MNKDKGVREANPKSSKKQVSKPGNYIKTKSQKLLNVKAQQMNNRIQELIDNQAVILRQEDEVLESKEPYVITPTTEFIHNTEHNILYSEKEKEKCSSIVQTEHRAQNANISVCLNPLGLGLEESLIPEEIHQEPLENVL